ncbi:MAG: alpha-2-macroglobulin, partial [Patescibacteria group bacterium]|nr:alpha-2-macroglobulin [Patescibacteria group bacterium]
MKKPSWNETLGPTPPTGSIIQLLHWLSRGWRSQSAAPSWLYFHTSISFVCYTYFVKRLDIFFRKTLVGLLSLVFLFTTAQVAITSYNSFTSTPQQPQPIEAPDHFLLNEQLTQESAPEQVLGDSDRAISFSGADNSISDGGVIVLNAKDRAQITVTNYNKPGNATFKLYKVSKDDLLNYLLYRKTSPEPYSSIEKIFSFDTSSISIDSSFEQEIKGTTTDRQWSGEPTPLSLPVDGSGIWYLEGELNGLRSETMIVRSNLAAIIHKGNNENIFWVQDTNYQNSADTTIELINTENSVTRLGEFTTDGDGIVKDAPNDALDVAVVSKNDEITIIPVNLYNLNYRLNTAGSMYSSFSRRQSTDRDFTFTDRFLYKPGDTVYFKSIIRTEDDVEFSIQPRTLQAIVGSEDDPIWQQTLQISELGTVDGAIPIPQDLEAGYYNITIKENEQYFTSAYFQVANFRKPDASVTVTTDKLMYLPGQEVTVSLKGTAFLGQPLRNQKVRYKIYQLKADISGDYSEMTYSQRNAYIGQNSYFKEGAVTLDKKGVAEFKLKAENTTGFRQFWVVHIEYLDGASVAANDMVQTLIQPGDLIIDNDGTDSSFIVNQDSQYSLKLSKNKVDAEI